MVRSVYVFAVILGVSGCIQEPSMPEPSEGAAIFAENCTACHGVDGQGGAISGTSQTAPDLTRIAARNGGVFPDAQVLSEIDGYAKGTHPARIMPEFGASMTGDTVPLEVDGQLTPTPRPLAALLTYLQSVQRD